MMPLRGSSIYCCVRSAPLPAERTFTCVSDRHTLWTGDGTQSSSNYSDCIPLRTKYPLSQLEWQSRRI